MDDLTAFITARLDEDEAVAKDAETACWHVDYCDELGAPFHARHDPARALREVAAKRKRLANYAAASAAADRYDDQYMAGVTSGLADAIKDDAAVWSDHPDYKPEWSPQ